MSKGLDDLLAEWERERISERTLAALDVKRARGERLGSIPYGQQLAADGVHLEPNPHEQATLARIQELRGKGASFRAIVAQLNAEAVPARGSRWHLTAVSRLVA